MQHELYYVLSNCNVTRKEVARRLGVHRLTLRAWESGKTRFKGMMLVRVCEVTGFPISKIPKAVRDKARFTAGVDTEELYDIMVQARADQAEQRYNSPNYVAGREKARVNRERFRELKRLEDIKKGA